MNLRIIYLLSNMVAYLYSQILEIHYWQLIIVTWVYFLFLYFVIGKLFIWGCHYLESKGKVSKIINIKVLARQKRFEIKYSLLSIFIFGFSGIPIVYLIREGHIHLLQDTWLTTFVGLIILNIWNEIHFFIIHRLMHTPFFMTKVHYIHHRSAVPTVHSVYSFHWLESLLLSTVPLCIVPFIPFSLFAIILYPLTSILLNFAGHCNYRFGNGFPLTWKRFGTLHAQHHFKSKNNYGFATQWLDNLNQLFKSKQL